VGDFSNPSVEKILALKPRLVFATLPEQQTTVDKLRQMGVNVFISRPNTLDSMFKEIKSIGSVLGAGRQADSLVSSLQARLDRIPARSSPVRVYLEISGQPLMTVGKSSFIDEAIARAGGTNVFDDIDKEYPVVTQEQVIARNPDVVFILHPQTTRTEFLQRLGWQDVSAVKSGRVYDDVNPDLLFRSGPRIVDGIEAMATRIASSKQ
jgi:iron complex transport system substrate-binding protein